MPYVAAAVIVVVFLIIILTQNIILLSSFGMLNSHMIRFHLPSLKIDRQKHTMFMNEMKKTKVE